MKKLELNQMENLEGGLERGRLLDTRDAGCFAYGMAAGIASGLNPLVGGLTTFACYMMS
jgi:hypothetical protein